MRIFATAVTMVVTIQSMAMAQTSKQILEGAFSGAVEVAIRAELGQLGRVESTDGWGHTAEVWTGKTKVVPQGINTKVVKIMERKNDGEWKKAWVDPQEESFNINIVNVTKVPGKPEIRLHFDATCPMRGQAEYRKYKAGTQLISVTGNGRATLIAHVDMRVYLFEGGKKIGWETTSVDFKYKDVVLDRVGPVGGESAKILSDAFTGAVKQWFPKKERDAVAKAKTAISNAIKGNRSIQTDLVKIINQTR